MSKNRGFHIQVVESRRQRADFYRVRCDIYRDDPAAVIPLKSLEWLQLDPLQHPFYEHAYRQLWVAYRDGIPVGRIAAIVDDLHNEHYRDKVGFFGFFECPDDQQVADRLLETAAQWLRAQAKNAMRGPVSPSMKGEFGVLIEGHEHPPFIMMGHSPRYYDRLLQQAGLAPVRKFHSFMIQHSVDHESCLGHFEEVRLASERIRRRFPEIDIKTGARESLEQVLKDVNQIGNVIRSRGWGFVPLTEAELNFNIRQLRRILDPQTIIAAYIGKKMVGYNISIPNLNWAIQRCWGKSDWIRLPQLLYWLRKIPEIRLIAVGVDPEIRAKGIVTLVTKPMTDNWMRYNRWEFGWIDSENSASLSSLKRAIPMNQYKTYQLYEKPL